jgi:hypothetical protein
MSGSGRSRFLILRDIHRDGMFIAVNIMKCGWSNGFIYPSTWREYSTLEIAIPTTLIRGV